jgi:hypothetical protein
MVERKEKSKEEIARRAHELYVERGRQDGRALEDWVRAEKELSQDTVAGPSKTKVAERSRSRIN